MKKLKFSTPYDRMREHGEVNNGKIITESAGYVPAKRQIEGMILAGKRLDTFRKEDFDGEYGNDDLDDFEDPTRSTDFDLADASRHLRYFEAKQKENALRDEYLKDQERRKKDGKELDKRNASSTSSEVSVLDEGTVQKDSSSKSFE